MWVSVRTNDVRTDRKRERQFGPPYINRLGVGLFRDLGERVDDRRRKGEPAISRGFTRRVLLKVWITLVGSTSEGRGERHRRPVSRVFCDSFFLTHRRTL